jgi:hypothetical protein
MRRLARVSLGTVDIARTLLSAGRADAPSANGTRRRGAIEVLSRGDDPFEAVRRVATEGGYDRIVTSTFPARL